MEGYIITHGDHSMRAKRSGYLAMPRGLDKVAFLTITFPCIAYTPFIHVFIHFPNISKCLLNVSPGNPVEVTRDNILAPWNLHSSGREAQKAGKQAHTPGVVSAMKEEAQGNVLIGVKPPRAASSEKASLWKGHLC